MNEDEISGHVARMRDIKNPYRILVGKPEGKNHLQDLGVDGKMILKWILQELVMRMWTGFARLRIETNAWLF
jgi:hypothetical protein